MHYSDLDSINGRIFNRTEVSLGEAELREATSPEGIVKSRATTGSANPDKVAADLVREREALGLVAVEIQKLEQRRSLAEARLDLALCKTLAG